MGQWAHIDLSIPEPDMDVEVAPTVLDAQSVPNMLVEDACQTHDIVADPRHEIPLTQNHPSKCLNRMLIGSLPPSLHPFLSFFPHFSTYVAGDIPNNVDVPLLLRKCTLEMDSVAPIVLKLCMIQSHMRW